MESTKKWELFSHDADMGVRGYGPTLAGAYEMGAMALTAIVTDPALVAPLQAINITCSAPDPEILFTDWLNAIIYEMETRHMLFSQFNVQLDERRGNRFNLSAIIKGELIDRAKHQPAVDVKGATFTALKVKKLNESLWIAQCVIDV